MTGRAGTSTVWPDSGGPTSILAPILAAALVLALGLLLVMAAGESSPTQETSPSSAATSTQQVAW